MATSSTVKRTNPFESPNMYSKIKIDQDTSESDNDSLASPTHGSNNTVLYMKGETQDLSQLMAHLVFRSAFDTTFGAPDYITPYSLGALIIPRDRKQAALIKKMHLVYEHTSWGYQWHIKNA